MKVRRIALKALSKEKIKNVLYMVCLINSLSTSIILCGEIVIRKSFFEIYRYFCVNYGAFFILMILLSGIITMLYLVFNNIGISTTIVGVTYIALQIINYFKFTLKGEYVGLFDINLIREAVNISKRFNIQLTLNIIWSILCLSWLISITLIIKEKINSKKIRYCGTIISMIIIILMVNVIMNDDVINGIGIDTNEFNINENYENNGFLFTLINRAGRLNINQPENYNKENIKTVINKSGLVGQEDIELKPNIIIIMNEAFTDITELQNISVSEDPLSYFRQLQKDFTSGNVITPVFGGFTSQVEYQVLTGNSTFFTGAANIAYSDYIYDGFPSIVNSLNNIGYNSIAIHPYKKDFYSRDAVYSKLGFSRFITEEDFIDPHRIRSYISDQDLVERIIKEYEENKNSKPLFIHAVTMQNHGPYDSDEDMELNISVESAKLNESNKSILSVYANLLKESDDAFKYLVEYFKGVAEPTIIVMFGDHKPVLGNNFSAYRQLGIVDDNMNCTRFYDIYHTPFVIFNNFGLDKKYYSKVDSTYLGAIILKNAKLNYDIYFNHLYNQLDFLAAINEFFYVNGDGEINDINDIPTETQDVLDNLWLLQYDRIFGKNYIREN